jgi:hypothetical protein
MVLDLVEYQPKDAQEDGKRILLRIDQLCEGKCGGAVCRTIERPRQLLVRQSVIPLNRYSVSVTEP